MDSDEEIETIALWMLLEDEEANRPKRSYVQKLNLNRDRNGAMARLVRPMRTDCPDEHFNYLRMTRYRFDDLLRRVEPAIIHPLNHRMPIKPIDRLAMTLRYLCDGGTLIDKAVNYHIGSWTLSKIVKETCGAIWNALKDEYLRPPDRAKWQEISEQFWRKWNFPMALGAIDGKHIRIKAPPNSGSLYYNYKQFFSVVLLAMVDADYNFIFVDIGGYGREGDASLFRRSFFGQRMEMPQLSYNEGGLDIPGDNFIPGTNVKAPHVFLGDEAFALRRHLMKPFRRHTANHQESAFNYRLSTARRVVENAFAILASRFRILHGRIDLAPDLVDEIIKAVVVLHNYLKVHDANDYAEPRYMPKDFVDYRNDQGEIVDGAWRRVPDNQHDYARIGEEIDENPTTVAYDVRNRFKNYFVSANGKLPWQDRYVHEGHY